MCLKGKFTRLCTICVKRIQRYSAGSDFEKFLISLANLALFGQNLHLAANQSVDLWWLCVGVSV